MTGTPPTPTARLRREWTAVHPRLRPVVVALLGAGAVLAVLGVAGDAAGLWTRLPFLTNLASAVTGALFGLPVALVVGQRLLQVQAEANDRASAWRLGLRSVHAMRVAAGTLTGVDPDGAAAELARLVARGDAAVAEAREWADRAHTARSRPRRLRASMYQRTYLRQALHLHEAARRAVEVCATTGVGAGTAAPALDRIRSEAAFLHDHVRPMVLRLGGGWLPEPAARAVARPDEAFPAGLTGDGGRQLALVRELLDAVPTAPLAALLAESDAARAGLADPDRPLPLPPLRWLEDLRAALGGLPAQLDRAREVRRVVDDITDAAGRLAD